MPSAARSGSRWGDAFGNRPAAFGLAGSPTLDRALLSTAQAIGDGTLTLGDVLAGASFRLPLSAANGEGKGGGMAVWGRGERQALESTESALAWDGTVLTGQLGIDTRLRDDLLAGLMLSHSAGEFDDSGDDHESRMTSVHPYLGWTSPQGIGVWGTLGYGRGEIEIEDAQARGADPGKPARRSDTTLKTATLVADGPLISGGATTLTLKGEASFARVEVEGNDVLMEEQAVNANRLRLSLEGQPRAGAGLGRDPEVIAGAGPAP